MRSSRAKLTVSDEAGETRVGALGTAILTSHEYDLSRFRVDPGTRGRARLSWLGHGGLIRTPLHDD